LEPDVTRVRDRSFEIESIADICEVRSFSGRFHDPRRPADLLIEIPHGATRARHFETVERRLKGPLPADLLSFYFVNTDVGAPECAAEIARGVARPERVPELPRPRAVANSSSPSVVIVRSLVPRTFIDCNRDINGAAGDFRRANLTSAVPEYIRDSADVETLAALYSAYQTVAARAYDHVCGNGGLAIQLHTYAPRTVEIGGVGDDVVRKLREAYEPDRYATWRRRPDVDLITETAEGELLAAEGLVDAVKRQYRRIGIDAGENATYRLQPATLGLHHAARFPGRTLCVEINRARLADPFVPFEPMRLGRRKVRTMALPIVSACLETLSSREAVGA
jgi:hypothetical protein